MVRSISIFAFFALATILVIVLQPGPRPDYAYELPKQERHETSRNDVQVLPEPQVAHVLNAPDKVIAKLKAVGNSSPTPVATVGTAGSLERLQAALDASLGQESVTASDAPEAMAAATSPTLHVPKQRQTPAQAIAPELRDMSWQTLNALNGLAHVSKAPGQEGSLLSSIVRRSMGHVDGTQIPQPKTTTSLNAPATRAAVSAVINTQSANATRQTYVVASGDTLALIAIKIYGSALATDQLLAENPLLRQNPNALRIGQVLKYSAN